MAAPEDEARALDLFERLLAFPGNDRFRQRLLKRESAAVIVLVERLEAGHRSRAILPTELPETSAQQHFVLPEQVGPYRLIERIGQGGMGEVWRAVRTDGRFEQSVAIKFLHRFGDRRAMQAFDSERRILARLEHPGIVRLRDGGETEDGQPYLIMDLIAGLPIDEFALCLALRRKIDLFIQAARVVQFSHGKLIAHGDIKPSNILVDEEARVHLLDFGISNLLQTDGSLISVSGAMTRDFASPQRIAGAPPSVLDDVFALGILLRELARPEALSDLGAIQRRATHPEDDQRYESVSALVSDLDNWRNGLPVHARQGGLGYRFGKFARRNRLALGVTALVGAALLATTVIAVRSAYVAERARADASARYADAHGIANYLMFDLLARMANQPRSLALRANMAATAQTYLNRLAQVAQADPKTRLDTARGLWRLAAFQSKSAHPNLGQAGPAKENLLRAERMTAGLPGAEADRLRAHILLDRASLAANADNDLVLADKLITQAWPLVLRGREIEPVLAKIYYQQLANLRSWQGRYTEERQAARAGLALPALRDPLQDYDLHDALLDIHGDSYLNTNGRNEALAIYREQVALGVAAHNRWPDDRMVISRLLYARLNLGTILTAMERFDEALPVLETANAEARGQLAFEPADRWSEAQLSSVENAHAQTLAFMGRYQEAMSILHGVAARKRAAWLKSPAEVRLFRPYVQVRALIGEAQASNRRFAEQCRTDKETLGLYMRMQQLGALTKWDEDINFRELKRRLSEHCSN